jgi:hypothetical protein
MTAEEADTITSSPLPSMGAWEVVMAALAAYECDLHDEDPCVEVMPLMLRTDTYRHGPCRGACLQPGRRAQWWSCYYARGQ